MYLVKTTMDFASVLATVFLILSCIGTRIKGLVIVNGNDPGKCNQTIHGKDVLVQDRKNNEIIIFCTKNNGVYKWTTIGEKTPIGERFSPAYDCSKVLDHNPEAKDGMYWIDLGGTDPKQAYCDMTTDGGGYILFGRTNTSVTWTVPSSNSAVEPYGNPHWASHLGDAPILDLRIQIGKTEDLSKSLAHWSFRLQTERLLKDLMIVKHGCTQATPGIGNIAYVKDLQTKNIVTTKFRCSVFGSYHDPATGFGWNMMNSCLRKPCPRGFAFFDHDVIKFQTDYSGGFSYSVSGPISGIYQNSTAFVGCDKKKCCGCFGPAGGTDDYCGTDCKNRKNGTFLKNVYSWFWVRSSIPKKVWNKCMDYKVTTPNGDTVRYKLLDGNPTPVKGRCGKEEALLNDGIVVVPDGKTAKQVPAVPGLLKYRKDTKELYVRANESWSVIVQEKKMDLKFMEFEKKFKKLLPRSNQLECSSYTWLNNQDRNIKYSGGGNALCDRQMPTGWYRFGGAAGTQLPTTCIDRSTYPSSLMCHAHAVSWLNGAHPYVADGKVTRTVYFSWANSCQSFQTNIEVINCGLFYIYKFGSTPGCSLRYCGTDV